MSKYARTLLIMVALSTLGAVAYVLSGARLGMNAQDVMFGWKSYTPSLLARLDALRPLEHQDGAGMMLDLRFTLPRRDEKLENSLFIIAAYGTSGSVTTLYRGRFNSRLLLDSMLRDGKPVEVSFWALHEPSMTFMTWQSQKAWSLSSEQPLYIELYEEYHDDADGWFWIRSGQ